MHPHVFITNKQALSKFWVYSHSFFSSPQPSFCCNMPKLELFAFNPLTLLSWLGFLSSVWSPLNFETKKAIIIFITTALLLIYSMHWKYGNNVASSFWGTYFGFPTEESSVLTDLRDPGISGVHFFVVPHSHLIIGSRSNLIIYLIIR